MPTSPLTGSRYPDSTYAVTLWTWIEQAVRDLEDNGIPYYASATDRNTAYTNWVAAGNAMRDGLHCMVGGVRYVYLSGAWKEDPIGYQAKMMRAQRQIDTAGFPNGAWTAFGSDTNWTETDPWGMRGAGGTLNAVWTGWYQINAVIWYGNNATGVRGLGLQPSTGVDIGEGSGALLRLTYAQGVAGGFDTIVSGSHLTHLPAGATVDLTGFQNAGTTLTVSYVGMSAAYLGPNT